MSKGVILTLDKKKATILTDDCRLVHTAAQPGMAPGKEINMDMNAKTKTVRRRYLRPALIAAGAIAVLAAALIFGLSQNQNKVYAIISVDVNPSMELSLNKNLEVISAEAMNEDAEPFLAGQNYRGMFWKDAVEAWTEALRQSSQIQVKNMLISAVMPEDAEQLRTQLMSMEGAADAGKMKGIAVRIIYSYDRNVSEDAARNGLSVGRQMLLNRERTQERTDWDAATIENAPLDELMDTLLTDGEQNQTRVTNRNMETNQSEEATAGGAAATSRETNQETNRETSQAAGGASGETSRETNRETSRETSGDGTCPSGQQSDATTARETSRQTLQTREESTTCSTCESSQIQQKSTYGN